MSDFSTSLGELRETNQVVEDTVEYCDSLLSQFSQQEGVDTNIMEEAKDCVRNAKHMCDVFDRTQSYAVVPM